MKVWQVTWLCVYPDRDRRQDGPLEMNPLFTDRQKAKDFLDEIAAGDWKAVKEDDTKPFPGLEWDTQYEWILEGRFEDEELSDNRYLAQEVEVR